MYTVGSLGYILYSFWFVSLPSSLCSVPSRVTGVSVHLERLWWREDAGWPFAALLVGPVSSTRADSSLRLSPPLAMSSIFARTALRAVRQASTKQVRRRQQQQEAKGNNAEASHQATLSQGDAGEGDHRGDRERGTTSEGRVSWSFFPSLPVHLAGERVGAVPAAPPAAAGLLIQCSRIEGTSGTPRGQVDGC